VAAAGEHYPVDQNAKPSHPENHVVALDNADTDRSGVICRSDGTSEYSAAAYSLLMDFLPRARSPGPGIAGAIRYQSMRTALVPDVQHGLDTACGTRSFNQQCARRP
jgi:hypothetical protein